MGGFYRDSLLNPLEQERSKKPLSKGECFKALTEMKCNKTPVSDGSPAEFYKVFWKDISEYLINSYNFAYFSGHFSVSQKRGIIKPIPKKGSEPFFCQKLVPNISVKLRL